MNCWIWICWSGSSWDHLWLSVISCSENEKTTWGGGFSKVRSVGELLNQVTVLCETSHLNCPFSVAALRLSLQELCRHSLQSLLREPSYQWLPPLAIFRVCSGLDSSDSYRDDVVVGLNGGFLHTAQLGANCLNGTGRGDLGKASTTTRTPHDGNRRAQEGAIRWKRLVSL